MPEVTSSGSGAIIIAQQLKLEDGSARKRVVSNWGPGARAVHAFGEIGPLHGIQVSTCLGVTRKGHFFYKARKRKFFLQPTIYQQIILPYEKYAIDSLIKTKQTCNKPKKIYVKLIKVANK